MIKPNYLFGIILILSLISACTSSPISTREASSLDIPGVNALTTATLSAPTSTGVNTATLTSTPTPSPTLTPIPTATPSPIPIPTYIAVPTHSDVPALTVFSSPSIRVLEQPVAVVRDGITLAVEQMVVYPERIELVYTIRDIPQSALHDPIEDDVSLSCGGPASYANLRLPDGTIIYPENYLLDGKAFDMFEPYSWGYIIHLYQASIPQDVSEITFVLECIGVVKLNQGLENWEVAVRIVPGG
jgi:hypothetical protein